MSRRSRNATLSTSAAAWVSAIIFRSRAPRTPPCSLAEAAFCSDSWSRAARPRQPPCTKAAHAARRYMSSSTRRRAAESSGGAAALPFFTVVRLAVGAPRSDGGLPLLPGFLPLPAAAAAAAFSLFVPQSTQTRLVAASPIRAYAASACARIASSCAFAASAPA